MSLERPETLLDGGASPAWDSTAMTGTATCVTAPVELGYGIKYLSMNLTWTNPSTVVGTFTLEETNVDPSGTPLWVTVPSASVVVPTVNNNAGPGMVRAFVQGRYARLKYVNTSGSGVLSAPTVHGKLR